MQLRTGQSIDHSGLIDPGVMPREYVGVPCHSHLDTG